MIKEKLKQFITAFKEGQITEAQLIQKLSDIYLVEDLGFAQIDHHREKRQGFPEVIYCPGKTASQILKIAQKIITGSGILLATKADQKIYQKLKSDIPDLKYNEAAGVIYTQRKKYLNQTENDLVVISAGTSDMPVAEEAAQCADVMGYRSKKVFDVGVSGLHRLMNYMEVLQQAGVIIVIAGMEGALPSVVGGLVNCPVIAVPTSTGYGTAFGGITALLSMLNSCANGIAVVNIDNGFGAAFAATRILNSAN